MQKPHDWCSSQYDDEKERLGRFESTPSHSPTFVDDNKRAFFHLKLTTFTRNPFGRIIDWTNVDEAAAAKFYKRSRASDAQAGRVLIC